MAAAATLFAACSQSDVLNEVQVQDEAQAIGFSTYSGKATRAENNGTATNTTDLEAHHSKFKVWGYKNTYTTGYVFYNVIVGADGAGNWTYADEKYWDKAATSYQFYAAAPADYAWVLNAVDSENHGDDYFSLVNFGLEGTSLTSTSHGYSFGNVNDQDLMIASPCVMDRAMFGNKVQLAFNHILSRLNVTVNKGANLNNTGATLNVTSFKVYKLKNSGSFNEKADLDGAVLANGTTKRWNVAGSPEYTIAGNALADVQYNNAGNQYIFQALVIPQVADSEVIDRDGSSVEAAPYFTIEYTIDDEPYSATFNLAAAFAKSGLALCEGYENTLNLTIDAETIVFDASVYEWTDKNVNSFDIK